MHHGHTWRAPQTNNCIRAHRELSGQQRQPTRGARAPPGTTQTQEHVHTQNSRFHAEPENAENQTHAIEPNEPRRTRPARTRHPRSERTVRTKRSGTRRAHRAPRSAERTQNSRFHAGPTATHRTRTRQRRAPTRSLRGGGNWRSSCARARPTATEVEPNSSGGARRQAQRETKRTHRTRGIHAEPTNVETRRQTANATN